MDINELIEKRRRYRNFRDRMYTLIDYLESAIANLDTPSSKIDDYYNIDSTSIDNGNLTIIRERLIDKKNFLKNTVMNKILNDIRELDNEIGSAG